MGFNRKDNERQKAMFRKIWDERAHVCVNCGVLLPYPNTRHCHHLLEKSKYKELRWEEKFIVLLCFDCHANYHNGKPMPLIEDLKEQALNKIAA